jgi:curli biogenesis system outer membrane secretion channel CsgG
VVFAVFLLPVHASGNTDRHSPEKAAQTAAMDISKRINSGTVAVVKIFSPNENLSLQIIRWLENQLLENRKLTVVSRQQINALLSEQEFGLSGYVDDESAQKIGHLLGAQYVLSGEIITVNGVSLLNVQVLETETAMLIYSKSFQIEDEQKKERDRQNRF